MAQIIKGNLISREIREAVGRETAAIKEQYGMKPGLAVVQVGNREDSNVYVKKKIQNATELGMHAEHRKLPQTVEEAEVLETIDELNEDPNIHGIIVQLPLDSVNPIDSAACTNRVLPEKDVDGINDINAGRLARGQLDNCFVCCTPKGCLELIKGTGAPVKGQNAVVLGRSKIVGSPMANLLTWHHATVTICHSKTRDLPDVVRNADIVVAAVGQVNMVKGSWIKPGSVVIDCGITAVPDASKKSGQRLVGDVDYAECQPIAGWITPVPGGVGPMTVAMLLQNTVESCRRFAQTRKTQQAGLHGAVEALKLVKRLARFRF